MRILLIIILLPIFIALLIFGAWFIAVPEGMIHDFISNSAKSDKILIKPDGIEKGLFFTLNIGKIEIKKKDETSLLTIENVQIKPDLMSLIKLTPQLPFTGNMHSGVIEGIYGTKDDSLNMRGKDIKLEEIQPLKLLNIEGQGNLSFKMETIKGEGEIIFNVREAKLKTTILPGGYILPLNWFNDIKALLAVRRATTEIKSFTLEGDGVYARIKGNITGDALDLKMELMPDASFKQPSLLMLIEPFKASPGYYVIPINLKGLLVLENGVRS